MQQKKIFAVIVFFSLFNMPLTTLCNSKGNSDSSKGNSALKQALTYSLVNIGTTVVGTIVCNVIKHFFPTDKDTLSQLAQKGDLINEQERKINLLDTNATTDKEKKEVKKLRKLHEEISKNHIIEALRIIGSLQKPAQAA